MIVQYQVVNPGPFFFHCHIHTHMASEMAFDLLDGIDAWPQVPEDEDQNTNFLFFAKYSPFAAIQLSWELGPNDPGPLDRSIT
ncbi:Multicopper oxidase type 2 [Penicillium fimorum]|uniref:Multicopper oxidase type 2 n=1 Tax=Penicillium fimorum TaxID=1882269 RepID=A0A9W9XXY0_9EURO|nr:Multicopper oxidase type 2 [Penicillium fimorum]